jgi:phosphatidylglycerol:prolipoprotein diacylglycerol transferase
MFPRLFTIGDFFTLHTYGLMVATALLVGIYTAGRFAPRIGVDPDKVWNLGIYMALAGLLGAKLFLVFSEWGYYSNHVGEIFSTAILHAGGVWHGGLLLAIAVGAWYTWRHKLAFAALGDVYAPGISLGHAFGRLGCFSAGCCWGTATDAAWAVTFTDPYSHKIVGVPLGIALHPTQLYEAGAEAIIFTLLVWLWRRRSFSGQIFATYLMLYAVARFIIEFFRGDPRGGAFFDGALSMPQVVSVVLFIVAGAFWFYQRRRSPAAPAHAR